MKPKVSVLTNIPAPYRLPVFSELASLVDLQVIFDARSEPNRPWQVSDDLGFRHVYANGKALTYTRNRTDNGVTGERYLQLRYNLLRHLRDFRPDVVVSSEMGLRTLQAEIYCRMARIPMIIWNEGTIHTEGWVSSGKRVVRRHLTRAARRFWTNGKESTALLESYGAAPDRIDPGMMAVETGLFGTEVNRALWQDRDEVRRSLQLEGTTFCFVGEFIRRKGIHEYLESLRCLRSAFHGPFSALFVGDGPERQQIEEWGRQHNIPLKITGYKKRHELPPLYAAADVFVLPTLDDNWALVTLEAAFAGLPQVFSKFNGATADLVEAGAPGTVVNPFDVTNLTSALENYAISRPERTSNQIREKLSRIYSPWACANRMRASIERGLELPSTGSIELQFSEVSEAKAEAQTRGR
jgi:glycosyltransferase involved in cell wall biosynthesis